jgi:hypothetical protein
MQFRQTFQNTQYLFNALSVADWFVLMTGVALVGLLTLVI